MSKTYSLTSRDRDFEDFLSESLDPRQYVDPETSGVDNVRNKHQIERPDIVDKLNAFLHTVSLRQYVNPYQAVERIRMQLARSGLHFDDVFFTGDSGTVQKYLTQHGGRFGFVDMDGIVKSDDGISHRIPGGLDIRFNYVKTGGVYTIDAQIVPGARPPSEPISESKWHVRARWAAGPEGGDEFTVDATTKAKAMKAARVKIRDEFGSEEANSAKLSIALVEDIEEDDTYDRSDNPLGKSSGERHGFPKQGSSPEPLSPIRRIKPVNDDEEKGDEDDDIEEGVFSKYQLKSAKDGKSLGEPFDSLSVARTLAKKKAKEIGGPIHIWQDFAGVGSKIVGTVSEENIQERIKITGTDKDEIEDAEEILNKHYHVKRRFDTLFVGDPGAEVDDVKKLLKKQKTLKVVNESNLEEDDSIANKIVGRGSSVPGRPFFRKEIVGKLVDSGLAPGAINQIENKFRDVFTAVANRHSIRAVSSPSQHFGGVNLLLTGQTHKELDAFYTDLENELKKVL